MIVKGPMYFDSVVDAANFVRRITNCKRKRSYKSGSKLINVCADGSKLIMRIRIAWKPRMGQYYAVLDWAIWCRP